MKQAAQILTEILSERKASNASYSLRAFARDIGLSAPQLSNVMNGNRGLSPQMAAKVSEKLPLSPSERIWFTETLKVQFSRSENQKKAAAANLEKANEDLDEKHLSLDLFKIVSTWHHFALVELIKISKHKKNPVVFFSKKLGIPEIEVSLSLDRLKKLNLISESKSGFKVNQDSIIADLGIPTEAVRKYHKQILEKATQAITFQTSEERYGYSGSMPMKVKSIDRARKLIQKFKSDFAKELSDEEGGEEIYGFSFQIFKITNEEEKQVYV